MSTERPTAKTKQLRPVYGPIQAGFPSPAGDYVEDGLDIEEYLIRNKAASFYYRIRGDSMFPTIQDKALVVVDRSRKPRHGHIVIASVNGEYTVKRFFRRDKKISLNPDNQDFPEIPVAPETQLEIVGVITFIIHDACTP